MQRKLFLHMTFLEKKSNVKALKMLIEFVSNENVEEYWILRVSGVSDSRTESVLLKQ